MSIESFRGPGGATLRYRLDDFTDPWKDAPTMVMVHGFGGFSGRWYRWVPPLAGHFRVVRFDIRGLGLSKVPAETYAITLDTLALDAIALLDHLKVKKVVWVGEHTGALMGVTLAGLVPERLHALCVMGAPLRPLDIPGFQPAAIAKAPEVLGFRESLAGMQRLGMRAWLEAFARALGRSDEFPPGYNDWYLDQMAEEDAVLVAKFRSGMIETDVRPRIPQIAVPTLWVEGDRVPALIPEWRALVAANPRIRIVDLPGLGNAIAYRQPEACVAEVKKFLAAQGLWPD